MRGPSRGEAVHKLVDKEGKLSVGYRKEELRVHGRHASKFASQIGNIVRHHAPLQHSGWGSVPKDDKFEMTEQLKVIFS